MRLRLYHHHDGARVAYRETGAGPALALLHSLGLSHREWEPIVAPLAERFRGVGWIHWDLINEPSYGKTPWKNFPNGDAYERRAFGSCCSSAGSRIALVRIASSSGDTYDSHRLRRRYDFTAL